TRQVTVSASTLTVGGVISGSGFGLTKAGGGTLTLTAANIYSGATTVSAGTLTLGGFQATAASSAFTVSGGATRAVNNSSGITSASVTRGSSLTLNGAANAGGAI